MGMDVYGRNPSSKDGEYFRASIWSWRPIHALLAETCGDLLSEKMLHSFGFNDGAGPKSQKVCDSLAARLNLWLEHNIEGTSVECPSVLAEPDGRLVDPDEASDQATTPYSTSDDHIREFVRFLRACGGFRVC